MHDQLMLPYGRTTGMLVVASNVKTEMEKFENSIFNEQWDKALEFISKDEKLILEMTYNSECQGNVTQQRTFDIISCADCCPINTYFDGLNCWFFNIPQGYLPLIYNNSFYTKQNCEISNSNNCCPPATTYDGTNCFFGYFPAEFNGFIYENSFYTNSDCEYCPYNRMLIGTTSSSQKVDVQNNIQSTSKIQGTPIIYYNAGNNIKLQSGFSVSAGSSFSATIKHCNPQN